MQQHSNLINHSLFYETDKNITINQNDTKLFKSSFSVCRINIAVLIF